MPMCKGFVTDVIDLERKIKLFRKRGIRTGASLMIFPPTIG